MISHTTYKTRNISRRMIKSYKFIIKLLVISNISNIKCVFGRLIDFSFSIGNIGDIPNLFQIANISNRKMISISQIFINFVGTEIHLSSIEYQILLVFHFKIIEIKRPIGIGTRITLKIQINGFTRKIRYRPFFYQIIKRWGTYIRRSAFFIITIDIIFIAISTCF